MTLKRLRLRGSTLKPAEAPAETDAPSGGVVTSGLDRNGLPIRRVVAVGDGAQTNYHIQIAAVDLAADSQRLIDEMLASGLTRAVEQDFLLGQPSDRPQYGQERIYRQNPATAGESPIDTVEGYSVGLSAERMGSIRYRTFRVNTPHGPRIEQRVESQPAGYDLDGELPEVQDLMSRAYFGRVYASLYGIPAEPRTREDYLVGGHSAALGWRPSANVRDYQRYVFRIYAPLLKSAELGDFQRIVEDHPNEVNPHLAYVLYCASLAKVPRGNRAIQDATILFREVAFFRCPRVVDALHQPGSPMYEIVSQHLPHHFICGTEGS